MKKKWMISVMLCSKGKGGQLFCLVFSGPVGFDAALEEP